MPDSSYSYRHVSSLHSYRRMLQTNVIPRVGCALGWIFGTIWSMGCWRVVNHPHKQNKRSLGYEWRRFTAHTFIKNRYSRFSKFHLFSDLFSTSLQEERKVTDQFCYLVWVRPVLVNRHGQYCLHLSGFIFSDAIYSVSDCISWQN